MPDTYAPLRLTRTAGTSDGTLHHGEALASPVRNIRRDEAGALCFDVLEDTAWLELRERIYARVRG